MIELPTQYRNIDDYTNGLCHFLSTPLVRQITGGIHVNDAFILNGWDALPREWTEWWSSIPDYGQIQRTLIDSIDETNGNLADEYSQGSSSPNIQPESLTKWLKRLKSLAFPRAQRHLHAHDLPVELAARMDTKKIAEVSLALAHIRDVCKRKAIRRIVDMGSGQGYLSVSLAYLFPDFQILSIDGSQSQISGAKEFADSLAIPENRLRHLVSWIDSSMALAGIIQDWLGDNDCIIVGLHACGTLSETMIRYFVSIPRVVSIAVVGCCYNHISPCSSTNPDGFPISSGMRERGFSLSSTALMTGCQAPNNWPKFNEQRRVSSPSPFAKRHLYRSILEKLLFDKRLNSEASSRLNWGIRKGDLATFRKFARRALHSLKIADSKILDEELDKYWKMFENRDYEIAILWTLGVICCKVVESAIALDRCLFLAENNAVDIDLVPIFDMAISPRNLMITANKTKT
ncbi:hypothetical protein VHEMI10397 [[Torrubiella] hemipterigena]|uniref:Methyltransferase domain-containing protein n=1 Tax=[Torrubiella] hemipterigena TaxID=1531966 RepID=A0A0A1TRS2_9HYPO|nr:hypothetical protein VHEMI10397 [[Torrubiella] hemipterigena]